MLSLVGVYQHHETIIVFFVGSSWMNILLAEQKDSACHPTWRYLCSKTLHAYLAAVYAQKFCFFQERGWKCASGAQSQAHQRD